MRNQLLRIAAAILFTALLPAGAAAQGGRVGGLVRDDGGQPIKGAIVTAGNPDQGRANFTAATDEKGRFVMIGLPAGVWRFVAYAPGHTSDLREMPIRVTRSNPPLTFTLRKNGPGPDSPIAGIAAEDIQAQLATADALFDEQQWDEAIAAYREIVPRAPALAIVNLQIAAAHRNKRDYGAAIAAYNAVLTADPDNETATVGIYQTYVEQGDLLAAEETLRQAAERGNAGREIFNQLAELKLASGEAQQASDWYQRAAEADPFWGRPLYQLGLIARNRGDREATVEFMTQAIATDPRSPEAGLAQAVLDELER